MPAYYRLLLNIVYSNLEIFFHHSGIESSQIDYIMSTEKTLIRLYYIFDKEPENISSHVITSCRINNTPSEVGYGVGNKSTNCMKKNLWDGSDRNLYGQNVQEELPRDKYNSARINT